MAGGFLSRYPSKDLDPSGRTSTAYRQIYIRLAHNRVALLDYESQLKIVSCRIDGSGCNSVHLLPITFQKLTKDGLKNISETVETLAEVEGLQAHKNAVSIRLK